MVSSGTPSTPPSEPAGAPAPSDAPGGEATAAAPAPARTRAPRAPRASAATRKAASPATPRTPRAPASRALNTLAIDIGGTGIKASVLDPQGVMQHERVRVATPYPLSPVKLVNEIETLIKELPPFDRVSAGFPGMVRGGHIL